MADTRDVIVQGGPGAPCPKTGWGGNGVPGVNLDWSVMGDTPLPENTLSATVGGGGTRPRISRDEMFGRICLIVAQRSTCLRSQVGALIVKDGRIVSMGYNGPVAGMPACIKKPPFWDSMADHFPREDQMGWELTEYRAKMEELICMGPGCTRSLHAETNAIAFAARAGVSVENCVMYCSMSPCINCAKVIVNSGIRELKYLEEYRDTSGLELLTKANIYVEHLKLED